MKRAEKLERLLALENYLAECIKRDRLYRPGDVIISKVRAKEVMHHVWQLAGILDLRATEDKPLNQIGN